MQIQFDLVENPVNVAREEFLRVSSTLVDNYIDAVTSSVKSAIVDAGPESKQERLAVLKITRHPGVPSCLMYHYIMLLCV